MRVGPCTHRAAVKLGRYVAFAVAPRPSTTSATAARIGSPIGWAAALVAAGSARREWPPTWLARLWRKRKSPPPLPSIDRRIGALRAEMLARNTAELDAALARIERLEFIAEWAGWTPVGDAEIVDREPSECEAQP